MKEITLDREYYSNSTEMITWCRLHIGHGGSQEARRRDELRAELKRLDGELGTG